MKLEPKRLSAFDKEKAEMFIGNAKADNYVKEQDTSVAISNKVLGKAKLNTFQSVVRIPPDLYKAFVQYQTEQKMNGKRGSSISFNNTVIRGLEIVLKDYISELNKNE